MDFGARIISTLCLVCFIVSDGEGAPRRRGRARYCNRKDRAAVCNMVPNYGSEHGINGTIYFYERVNRNDCSYDFLEVHVDLQNVPSTSRTKLYGLHIHENGDMRQCCDSMGGHYNPRGSKHGAPWDLPGSRHVGDLGNLKKSRFGNRLKATVLDYLATLVGPESILGRGVVLHGGEDDLGRNKNDPGSVKSGNSGKRLACCVIEPARKVPTETFTLYR